ncbi:MAG TPA: amidohydrolase family protein [Gemmatimonadales bacterium]
MTFAACTAPGKGVTALVGATLIDGSGGPPVQDALILIKGGRIQAVARVNEIKIPRGATQIDLIGKTIVPGLIDAHAHAERWAMQRYLAWGVTTIRDLGGDASDSLFALRADANLGSILAPRMFTSGAMIDGAPATYPTATGVETATEARRAVDQRVGANADYVKIYTKITPELLTPLMDEAGSLKTPVAAHLGKTDALTAAKAGVVSLEHMSGVVEAAVRNPAPYFRAHDQFLAGWTLEEKGWATLDSASLAVTARALAGTHVAIVPTLVVHETLAHLADPGLLERPEMADVPADTANVVRRVASLLRRSGWTAADFQAFRRSRAREDEFVREFRRAGGLVAAGSDAANQLLVPGAALHEEMALLVAAGLTPLEAITAATRHNATLLGADSIGAVQAGKLADLVVLNANPAADIAATRDIAWVMSRGTIIHPDSLRREWKKGH